MQNQVLKWFKKAGFDYEQHYIYLFIAYSSWYQSVTGTTNDRQALTRLKRRFAIWEEYLNGMALFGMKECLEKIADYTQRRPFISNIYWSGTVENSSDWQSLIEFWYQVRCLLVHGTEVEGDYLRMAYDSLYIFMEEIVTRSAKHELSSLLWE